MARHMAAKSTAWQAAHRFLPLVNTTLSLFLFFLSLPSIRLFSSRKLSIIAIMPDLSFIKGQHEACSCRQSLTESVNSRGFYRTVIHVSTHQVIKFHYIIWEIISLLLAVCMCVVYMCAEIVRGRRRHQQPACKPQLHTSPPLPNQHGIQTPSRYGRHTHTQGPCEKPLCSMATRSHGNKWYWGGGVVFFLWGVLGDWTGHRGRQDKTREMNIWVENQNRGQKWQRGMDIP